MSITCCLDVLWRLIYHERGEAQVQGDASLTTLWTLVITSCAGHSGYSLNQSEICMLLCQPIRFECYLHQGGLATVHMPQHSNVEV